jgi:hypothetical protein
MSKDRLIGDILSGLNVELGVGAYPHTDAPFVIDADADVVFPPCISRATPIYNPSRKQVRTDRSAFSGSREGNRNYSQGYDRGKSWNRDESTRDKTEEYAATKEGIEEMVLYNIVPPYTYGRTRGTKYFPAFKMRHLLKEIAEALGYTLSVPYTDYVLDQSVLFSWRAAIRSTGEQYRSYEYFLPTLTLSEFIGAMRSMGTVVYVDSRTQVITAMPFSSILSRSGTDLTACAVPHPKMSEAFDGDKSVFSWGDTAEKVATLPSVATVFDLPAAVLGEIVLVERENRFYEAQSITIEDSSFVDWRPTENALTNGELTRGGMDVQSLFIPVPDAQVFYFTTKNVKIREYTPTGKVRLEGFLYPGLKKGEIQYRIIQPEELSTGWYTDLNPTATAIDDPVLNIIWAKDYDDAVVEYRTNLSYFDEQLMPDIPSEVAPYIALFHGEQTSGGATLYGYAGPTGYDPDISGARLSDQDLTWESIFNSRMSLAKQIIEEGKQADYKLYPKVHEAVQFNPIAPVVIDGVFLVPISFDCELGEVLKAEFSGWVV